jgi:hypothetical protein
MNYNVMYLPLAIAPDSNRDGTLSADAMKGEFFTPFFCLQEKGAGG